MISEFTKTVIQNILQIPAGRVATYKQIAELSGKPQASRGVSWILHSCSTAYKLPWHRVLNSKGQISFKKKSTNYREQQKRLEREGVAFSQKNGTGEAQLDLAKYQWKKKPSKVRAGAKTRRASPKMFQ